MQYLQYTIITFKAIEIRYLSGESMKRHGDNIPLEGYDKDSDRWLPIEFIKET